METPSAGFVVQLFVIPAIVVAVVIFVWLLFGKLAGGERDPAEYVRRFREGKGDWRSAFELASLIQNDSRLAADPHLLGELTELLDGELKQDAPATDLTVYLIKTLGIFGTLEATLNDGRKVDPIGTLAEALAPRFKPSLRMEAAASLARQAARLEGTLEDPRVVAGLSAAAAEGEPELRQVATYALGFVAGAKATDALRERVRVDEDRFVRYNAAVALGRRGDLVAAPTLKEMLSTADLDRVVEAPNADEKQGRVEAIQLEALGALDASISSGEPDLVAMLRPQVEELGRSGLIGVRTLARSVLQKLQPPGRSLPTG
ncbi:HEAT repeat domain-containing protein [Aquisphaera insulae]|uniref:HEAT repeat domain-containing protein n=1 Tax=Aquisphaera insulae TaxID=2712864 RepID=UPI00202E5F03|nr:HEAT repeat domain-containing protein [Aquisphaera insulae]